MDLVGADAEELLEYEARTMSFDLDHLVKSSKESV